MTEELKLFKELKSLKIVFDVGARIADNQTISCDITDYLKIYPKADYHLFEPNPDFFKELKEKVETKKNVFLNNYGLGDKQEIRGYHDSLQSFVGSEALAEDQDYNRKILIKTLDWYAKGIKRIDFLKIDTEGFDYKVLVGGKKTRKITRFIQYEHWKDKQEFELLLRDDFDMEYMKYRNVLCMSKALVGGGERQRIKDYIHKN